MSDSEFAALDESEYVLALADIIAATVLSGADAVILGPTDAALVEKLLRAGVATGAV